MSTDAVPIGRGPHTGQVEIQASTIDDAVAEALRMIRQFVNGRDIMFSTQAEPLQKTMNGDVVMWEVRVGWSIPGNRNS